MPIDPTQLGGAMGKMAPAGAGGPGGPGGPGGKPPIDPSQLMGGGPAKAGAGGERPQVDRDTFDELGLTRNRPNEGPKTVAEGENAKVGQDQFLKLMLAQIKHQDPMEPTENGEFLSQMATFSQAQGMKELTDTFKDLAQNLTSNQALQASSMIGRQVMTESRSAGFDGERPVQGAIELNSSGQDVTVSVFSPGGERIREIDIGQVASGRHSFSWDGKDEQGNTMPPGSYRISAEGEVGGEQRSLNTLLSTQVESVSMGKGGQGVKLNLAGGETLDLNQVREIM